MGCKDTLEYCRVQGIISPFHCSKMPTKGADSSTVVARRAPATSIFAFTIELKAESSLLHVQSYDG
jgi:hypothetical protein